MIKEQRIKKICCKNEGSNYVTPKEALLIDELVIDARGLNIIPGLVDLHFHGAVGEDFCNANLKSLEKIAEYEEKNGVLAICPATMTLSEEKLFAVMKTAREFYSMQQQNQLGGASLVGINLEGPFINPKKAGAQSPAYIQNPDVDLFQKLQDASGGMIKFVDMAPEMEGALGFIEKMQGQVCISLAHTCADYEQAKAAFAAGASHVTHLFNAMPGLEHRQPGPILAAIEDGVDAEIICDGVHVHPAMVRFALKNFGPEHLMFISDSMEATGMVDGIYELGNQQVKKVGDSARLLENPEIIAGSVTNLFDCMKLAIKSMGIPEEVAICCTTKNPARALGIEADYGSIQEGKYANLVLINEDYEISQVINKGLHFLP